MNQALKQKRDELADNWRQNDCYKGQSIIYNSRTMYADVDFKAGFDAAIAAVIELVGEFNSTPRGEPFVASLEYDLKCKELPDTPQARRHGFNDGARWQHSEIMKKIKGEE